MEGVSVLPPSARPAPPRIKFCGITRLADAELAVSLDAWAIGMILWPGSRRAITPDRAVEIAAAVKRKTEVAGVFVNPALDEVIALADGIGLTLVQLHGQEGPAFCTEVARRTGCRVIKAARVRSRADVQALRPFHTDLHLLDSYKEGMPGGTGQTFSWELARAHGRHVPVILSGGLTPENVAEAVDAVHPYAVDVASGVELEGAEPPRKDHARMRAFAAAVGGTGTPATPTPAPPEGTPAPPEGASELPEAVR
jgi:phosphoribosylanthranilate isomerase